MSNLQKALDYAHQNRERFLSELIEILKIPSISTDAEYNNEVLRAAEWMANHLKGLGIENVEIMPTDGGHPVVYGDYIQEHRARRPCWSMGIMTSSLRTRLNYGKPAHSSHRCAVIFCMAAVLLI